MASGALRQHLDQPREKPARALLSYGATLAFARRAAIAKGLAMPVRPAAVRLQMGRRWLSGAAFADADELHLEAQII